MRRHVTLIVALVAVLIGALSAADVRQSTAAEASPTAPPARASGSDDVPAPRLTQFRIVDHNIEHTTSALKRVLQRARKVKAVAITVQEICWWQARGLSRQHPDWTISWMKDQESGWCLKHSSSGEISLDQQDKRRGIGNVAIWTGGRRGKTSSITFRSQRIDDHRGMACVTWTRGARQRVCSVHLMSPKTRTQAKARTRQAREVHRITSTWISQDDLVVLGGDFNSQPKRITLDYLYVLRGRGQFREITPPPAGALGDCRCTQVTADGGRTKIDYVFFSANRMTPDAYRTLTITRTQSDHHMLNGWAMVDATRR